MQKFVADLYKIGIILKKLTKNYLLFSEFLKKIWPTIYKRHLLTTMKSKT
jgi:hypothetical protein